MPFARHRCVTCPVRRATVKTGGQERWLPSPEKKMGYVQLPMVEINVEDLR